MESGSQHHPHSHLTLNIIVGIVLVLAVVEGFGYLGRIREAERDKAPATVREAALAYLYLYRREDLPGNRDARESLARFWTDASVFSDVLADPPVSIRGGDRILEHHLALMQRTRHFKMWWEKVLARRDYAVIEGAYRRDFADQPEIYAGSFVLKLRIAERAPGDFVVLEHEEFLDYERGKRDAVWRQVMVSGCYVLWTAALVLMIVKGFKEKSYGMPMVSSATMLAMCYLTGYIGPWIEVHLFFAKGHEILLFTWRLWAWLLSAIFVQYLVFHKKHRHSTMFSLAVLAVCLITEWTYITFHQDYYVNELSPLVVLVMAIFFFPELSPRSDMKAMTPMIAWLLAVGTALLYVAVVLGDMKDAYPFKHHGYDFIYWVYLSTLVLMFAYAWIVTRRHRRRATPDPAPTEP